MGWVALIYRTTYEEAKEIADKYELACVSCRQYDRHRGTWDVQPIVARVENNGFWYNYLQDGTFKKTVIQEEGKYENPHRVYSPYYYVPDKIRYVDLLKFLKQHWLQFKGVYDVYMTYVTVGLDTFTYSVKHAIMNTPLDMPFDNPLLYFEEGRPIDTYD
jgi:hypothetical protein